MDETGKGAFRNGGRKTYIGLQKKKYFKYGPETVLCVRKCGAAGGGSAEEKTGDTQEKGSAACEPPGGEKQAVFLVAAAFCAVFLCVMYLRLQSEVVNHSENLTTLQEDLANLTEANNTAYNAAEDSVNLEEVRDKAMNEMGMVYESQGTVIEYESPASGYVKQYDSIPEDGVLAQSQDISN